MLAEKEKQNCLPMPTFTCTLIQENINRILHYVLIMVTVIIHNSRDIMLESEKEETTKRTRHKYWYQWFYECCQLEDLQAELTA